MKAIAIIGIVIVFALGILLGRQIGRAESETGFAKEQLIQTVQEMNRVKQGKMDELTGVIQMQMFIAVTGVRRLPRNPFWKIRYAFKNPFSDPVTQHFLSIAEMESRVVGQELFPQHYPPRISGSDGEP
jgi:hypothetical protein